MEKNMQMALNQALSERNIALQRQMLAGGGLDAKRPRSWLEYGYSENLSFHDYYKVYERHGIGHGAMLQLLDKCWQDQPWIIEGDEHDDKRPETQWERNLKRLLKSRKVMKALRKADEMRMVGHYSGLILQVADNKRWDQELGKVSERQLVRVIPAWEGQITVSQWDEDERSQRYGQPIMWQYQENAVRQNDQSGAAGRTVQIHHSRVVVMGDVREGVPLFRACFNDLVNLEKILGGSGESFLKNASRQLHIGFDKDVDLTAIARAYGVEMDELQTIFDEVTRGMNMGLDQTAVTQGASVTPLVASVPDPEEHFDIALQSVSAALRIPSTIIVGKQTGERASTEDAHVFNARCQSRRLNQLSDDIETFVRHLMRHGMVQPIEEFEVMWSDLTEWSQEQKLAAVKDMAAVNRDMIATGDVVFTAEEMRDAAGFDNDDIEDDVGETLPDEDDLMDLDQ